MDSVYQYKDMGLCKLQSAKSPENRHRRRFSGLSIYLKVGYSYIVIEMTT